MKAVREPVSIVTWTFDALDSDSTLLTVNNRLAIELRARYDRNQLESGRKAWPSADILPWEAWMQRLYQRLLDHGHTDLDLLSPTQERLLWEDIIQRHDRGQGLLRPAAAADSARAAYTLYHAWRLEEYPLGLLGGEETRSLLAWMKDFEDLLASRRLLSAAALPAILDGAFRQGVLRPPGRLIHTGFDDLSPLQAGLFDSLRELGSEIVDYPGEERQGSRQRLEAGDTEAEIRLAAEWARDLLKKDPASRIAVICVGITEQRRNLERLFTEVVVPNAYLDNTTQSRPFNISLGEPLSDRPLVAHALEAIRLLGGAQPLNAIGQLLRSPFIGGHQGEWERRALFDRTLREDGRPALGLQGLISRLASFDPDDTRHCPDLVARLQSLLSLRRELPSRDAPGTWAIRLRSALTLLGWPGDQPLDSHEYQQHERLQGIFSELAGLGKVRSQMTLGEAIGRLCTLTTNTLFQPKSAPAPIQILGPLEATGIEYDAAWLLGMDDHSWPPSPHPNPLLPAGLQRDLAMPHASAARELAFATTLTARLTRSAPTIVASHARGEAGREHRPSPLTRDWPLRKAADLGLVVSESLRQACSVRGEMEPLPAPQAGAASATPAGGAALIAAQANCPFAAVARFRMGARPLEEPSYSVDGALGGTLVHELLQRVWQALGDSDALARHDEAALQSLLAPLAAATLDDLGRRRPDIFTTRFKQIEAARLTRLCLDWLNLERGRSQGFRVEALELAQTVELGGLQLRTRIDRIDRLQDGSLALIDYKTGRNVSNDGWFDERLTEPQLPLYCLQDPGNTAAALLARVRRDGPGCMFVGLSRTTDFAPGVETPQAHNGEDGWPDLLAQWQQALEDLADEILQGRADATPSPQACRYCAFGPLCRVQELIAEERDD